MYAELHGRAALVTGGSSGLGECVVQHLLRAGVRVAIADLNAAAVDAPAEAGRCLRLSGDVSREDDVARFVSETHAAFGSVDILINCAGIPDTFQPTVDQDVAAFRRLVDVHLTGTYMMCKAVAPHMLAQARGSIINLSSVGGVLGLTPRNAYSAAKAGIGMLTRTLGCEWAASGVRVNAIAPGYILTPFAQRLMDEGKLDAQRIRRRTPAGRLGHPDHIADAMMFLASDRSEFITGVTLPVDGGYMSWGAASDAWQGG
jgi:NAD(P)-dependent dehydrogenase (short-subunit alcohol dehydrogenase family)